MKIDVLMPALSPTMEVGTLAKWLVKKGDLVKAGDLLAEIETDKAIMEFEAVEEGHKIFYTDPPAKDVLPVFHQELMFLSFKKVKVKNAL